MSGARARRRQRRESEKVQRRSDSPEQPRNTVMQFGQGVVFSKPIAGNPVTFWQYWTWYRVRVALFGSRARVIDEMTVTHASIVKRPDGGMIGRIDMGKLMDDLSVGANIKKSHMEWEKPAWMRRVAFWFKPTRNDGGGRG